MLYYRGCLGLPLLTNTTHIAAYLIEIIDFVFLWCMDDDDGGTNDRQNTANLPMEVQFLLQ